MRIGILLTGHASPEVEEQHGDSDAMFIELLAGHGFDFRTWDVEKMVFPASIHDADGWLISGSRHGVYEDHPFIRFTVVIGISPHDNICETIPIHISSAAHRCTKVRH